MLLEHFIVKICMFNEISNILLILCQLNHKLNFMKPVQFIILEMFYVLKVNIKKKTPLTKYLAKFLFHLNLNL